MDYTVAQRMNVASIREEKRAPMDIVTSFIVPALVGIVVGILSGLLGIGGGTILVPVFRLAFGMSPVMSTATSLFTIIPTSLSGAVSHVRHRTCVPSLGVAAGLGGAVTSPFGVWLATISPGWLIMVVAALVIGWSAVKILGKAIKMKPVGKARAQAGTAQQGTKQTGTDGAEPGVRIGSGCGRRCGCLDAARDGGHA